MRAAFLILLSFPLFAQNTAQFVKYDTTTSGAWKSAYGSAGFNVALDGCGLACTASGRGGLVIGPATVTWSGQLSYLWSAASDGRGLERAAPGAGNLAATWYAAQFSVDIVLSQRLQVAIYAVDWDSFSRSESITVLDGDTGAVLIPPMLISNYHGGVYAAWNLAGHVVLRFLSVSGANAVMSAIFLDAPQAQACAAPTAFFITTGTTVQELTCPAPWTGFRFADGKCFAITGP